MPNLRRKRRGVKWSGRPAGSSGSWDDDALCRWCLNTSRKRWVYITLRAAESGQCAGVEAAVTVSLCISSRVGASSSSRRGAEEPVRAVLVVVRRRRRRRRHVGSHVHEARQRTLGGRQRTLSWMHRKHRKAVFTADELNWTELQFANSMQPCSSARTAALQPINFVTPTRVTNKLSPRGRRDDMPPSTAVRLAADLRPSVRGRARSPQISGGRQLQAASVSIA